ncbi:unnamed protein product [Microthlaspi erraticum]|uniref:Uncharacterized protein n=1 Tax=Microthlaspi erraticum TaxID=1685480 RepID=A0A6D2KM13_9BRAS|nr:unnamed protein product [Microthlaspi erraticum]
MVVARAIVSSCLRESSSQAVVSRELRNRVVDSDELDCVVERAPELLATPDLRLIGELSDLRASRELVDFVFLEEVQAFSFPDQDARLSSLSGDIKALFCKAVIVFSISVKEAAILLLRCGFPSSSSSSDLQLADLLRHGSIYKFTPFPAGARPSAPASGVVKLSVTGSMPFLLVTLLCSSSCFRVVRRVSSSLVSELFSASCSSVLFCRRRSSPASLPAQSLCLYWLVDPLLLEFSDLRVDCLLMGEFPSRCSVLGYLFRSRVFMSEKFSNPPPSSAKLWELESAQ